MNISSQIQEFERRINEALDQRPTESIKDIFDLFLDAPDDQREAFVLLLIHRAAAAEGLRRSCQCRS